MEELLRRIWDERAQEVVGVKFTEGDVFVSVRGGEVLTGGAPLDLVGRKADEISALLYRTAELLIKEPHRRRGSASAFIQDVCRPWLFQAALGSYRFAMRVQQPSEQLDLFPETRLQIENVVPTFLRIMEATAESPDEGLDEIVADPNYRLTFLKLIRNLARTGKRFHELDLQSQLIDAHYHIVLSPESRIAINKELRQRRLLRQDDILRREVQQKQLSGILRGLQLDDDWLEITAKTEEGLRTVRIYEVGEAVDDVVGPFVNHEVLVDALVLPNGKHLLQDGSSSGNLSLVEPEPLCLL